MTFGPDQVLQCPGCRNLYVRNTVGTTNTLGARYWSDGLVDSPMIPVEPLVSWCEKCRTWFFIDDARVLFDLPFGTEPGDHKVIPVSDALEAEMYLDALGRGWPRDREIRLRVRLMWEYNHHLRNNHGKKDPATIESHDNLERLSEIIDPEEDPLMLAEVFRELGEFARAVELAQPLLEAAEGDDMKALRAGRIIEEANRRNIFPVLLNEEVLPPDAGLVYPECIDAGFYPYPVTEDVFAFADVEKEREFRPILSVHLSLLQREEDIWATFCYEDGSWLCRHDRLFTAEEWKEFLSWPEDVRNELIDFWEMKNFHLDQFGRYELDFYYRTLYRIFYGYRTPPLKEEFDRHLRRFRPVWKKLRDQLFASPGTGTGAVSADWAARNEYMIYWHSFWATFSGNSSPESLDAEVLAASISEILDDEKERAENRAYALRHIDYVELGNGPVWFKGKDRRPGAVSSEIFVGQFWSDYLGYGTKLLYLFYDPETSRFSQYHDYD